MNDQAVQAGPDDVPGTAIPFRFEVSWQSLTEPARLTQPTPPTSHSGGGSVRRAVKLSQFRQTAPPIERARAKIEPVKAQPLPLQAPNFELASGSGRLRNGALILGLGLALVMGAVAVGRRA